MDYNVSVAAPSTAGPLPMSAARLLLVCVGVLAAATIAVAQAAKPPAVKLPDGTVVIYTKSPDDLNPLPEGVLLPAAEYKALQEHLDAARKSMESAKPVAPSSCDIRGRVVARGERLTALLTVTYTVRTAAPRTAVALGTARAFPTAARLPDGKLPVLSSTDDGLAVTLEKPGDQTVTLEVEAPVSARGPRGEPGFELGLPRAAVTTLAIELPGGVKKAQVGLRTGERVGDKPAEAKWSAEEPAALNAKPGERGYPLGPVGSLELTWDAPLPANAPAARVPPTADIDITIRVEDAQIETTARLRLRGGAAQWLLTLPPTADVATERLASAGVPAEAVPNADPGLKRPPDAGKPAWTFRPPDAAADWLVTAVVRQARPKAADPKSRGPYPVGPFGVPTAARVAGAVRVLAAPTVRVMLDKSGVGLRRVDTPVPLTPDDEVAGLYRFATTRPVGAGPADAAPLCELTTRPLPGFQRIQPTYTLRRADDGWRLGVDVKVTPVRAEAEEVLIDVPAGWQAVEATATGELIDQVQVVSETPLVKRLAVKLVGPQRAAFDFSLTASHASPPSRRREELTLPRFPGGRESQAKLVASVPEGLEVSGTATSADGSPLTLTAEDRVASGAPPRAVQVVAERGIAKVDLAWQTSRPELAVESRAEVTWNERQAVVAQTLRFQRTEGDARPILLSGPAIDLRVLPPTPGTLEPLDRDTWQLRLPPDAPRDFTVAVSYALALPVRKADAGAARVPVALLTPDTVSRLDAHVRIWGGTSTRRVARADGPWRELPPEPAADRPSLPWLTLAGNGATLPLAVELADDAGPVAGVAADRALVQTWLAPDGTSVVRGRFQLRRWSGGGVDLEIPAGATPEVYANGRRIDAATLTPLPALDSPEMKRVRVPLPEAKPGKATLLDVRFSTPRDRDPRGSVAFPVPRLTDAVYRSSARQQWFLPADLIPLVPGSDAAVEQRWSFQGGLLTPTGAVSVGDADAWIASGAEADAEAGDGNFAGVGVATTDALTARQSRLAAVTVVLVPRVGWSAGCSLAVVVLGIVGYRTRPVALGLLLTAVGVAAALGAVLRPQVASQVVHGAQPGVAVALLGYAAVAAVEWYYRRRVAHLPGFTRNPAALSTTSIALDVADRPPTPSGTGSRTAAPRVNTLSLDSGSGRAAAGSGS